eukprot:TRINITY_DN27538_c0_g1_i1.p2 TRINITY_DN27538_c0_g1~~TRINITY_DN27538_c0_g1_i1.p2  ORF type:complete len:153 (+),score=22.30 TRINITY_DN27538_c0_g1_i1:106-564(+)
MCIRDSQCTAQYLDGKFGQIRKFWPCLGRYQLNRSEMRRGGRKSQMVRGQSGIEVGMETRQILQSLPQCRKERQLNRTHRRNGVVLVTRNLCSSIHLFRTQLQLRERALGEGSRSSTQAKMTSTLPEDREHQNTLRRLLDSKGFSILIHSLG